MVQQLRVYTTTSGGLNEWARLFNEVVLPLRKAAGFRITSWLVPERNQFVWLVDFDGTQEEFSRADRVYYQQRDRAFPNYHAASHALLDTSVAKSEDEVFLTPFTS